MMIILIITEQIGQLYKSYEARPSGPGLQILIKLRNLS